MWITRSYQTGTLLTFIFYEAAMRKGKLKWNKAIMGVVCSKERITTTRAFALNGRWKCLDWTTETLHRHRHHHHHWCMNFQTNRPQRENLNIEKLSGWFSNKGYGWINHEMKLWTVFKFSKHNYLVFWYAFLWKLSINLYI